MQIIKETSGLSATLKRWRGTGKIIALVPTMGALHAGHLALVERARELGERVVVSIFVNPTQFNDKGDLAAYPRDEKEDARKLQEAGVDMLWLPTEEQIYPPDFSTRVIVEGVSDRWEGEHRPGHFEGVATIVAKLFAHVLPDFAIFGEKDFQQLAVISRMNADLGFPVEVIGLETVRDPDGLALSSRNARLSEDERRRAAALPNALRDAKRSIEAGGDVGKALADAKTKLSEAGFAPIDYVALVDRETLEPLEKARGDMRIIGAAFMGAVRLIDNLPVGENAA